MPVGGRLSLLGRVARNLTSRAAVLNVVAAGSVAPVIVTGDFAAPAVVQPGVVGLSVPTGVGADPRTVQLVGETTSQGVVLDREADLSYEPYGYANRLLVQPDGSSIDIAATSADAVLEDSIVRRDQSTVVRTYLADGRVGTRIDTVTVPASFWVLGYTHLGVLGTTNSDEWNPVLTVYPWSGGVPITGLPAGVRLYGPIAHATSSDC